MAEVIRIDPFSHPDNDEKPIGEAIKAAHKRFSELGTGTRTGVIEVGMEENKICFYVRYQKQKYNLPKYFMGHECIVKVVAAANMV